jgi:hypothetical protein
MSAGAWHFIRTVKEEAWTLDDWRDLYESLDAAIERVATRHGYNLAGDLAQKIAAIRSDGLWEQEP